MLRNGSKMAKNALNDPIFGVQAPKTSCFLITNVIGPIQGQKRGKKIPPQNPPNKLLCIKSFIALSSFYYILVSFFLFPLLMSGQQSQ